MSTLPRLPVIGLVGGIGSGKSEVARMLAEVGCVVCDSDSLVRKTLREPAIKQELVNWWGPTILDSHGEINRKAVAHLVFASNEDRLRLEQLIHPRVEARRQEIFAAAPPTTPALVIDAPLLLEAGLGPKCDRIWFIDAPLATRIERVHKARGWAATDLERRESAQWPLDRKRSAAHDVLRNEGDSASLRRQVLQVLRDLPPVTSTGSKL
ncbi:MAG: dephospho-CoA kinase [Planctomycetes bacterium]|nr:dephospho-CoA kinase [Planctomycetota bacterium]